MRFIPHTRGERHGPSYSERIIPEILLSDIGRAYDVSVSFKPTRAMVFSAAWFMPASAGGARLRRVGFTDALHGHSVQSRLVLDHAKKLAVGPLVEPLVHLRSVVDPFADSCQVAHYNRSDPSLVEGLDQPRGLLVQEIFDLVSDLAQLSVLGAN